MPRVALGGLREFETNLKKARDKRQISAANQALQEQCKLAGLYLKDNLQKGGKMPLAVAIIAYAKERKRVKSDVVDTQGREGDSPSSAP